MLLYILYNVWVDKPVDKYFKKKEKKRKEKLEKNARKENKRGKKKMKTKQTQKRIIMKKKNTVGRSTEDIEKEWHTYCW